MSRLSKIQFERFYHGTSPHNVENVLKEGLKAHKPGEELDEMYGEDIGGPGHPKGVYFGDLETARNYGGAVFSVDLPSKHPNWGWTESEGHVWEGDIPPQMLRLEENHA
jgi:hypothetical protein